MKIVWRFFKGFSSLCRREKPLNGKRKNQHIQEMEKNTHVIDETESILVDTRPCDKSDKDILAIDAKILPLDEENQDPVVIETKYIVIPEELTGAQVNSESHHEKQRQTDCTDKTTLCQANGKSEGETTSAGEAHGAFSSEDSENEEIDGSKPYKKRKLIQEILKEGDKITREWEDDLRLIKNDLGRISHLFEVYDGFKNRPSPLNIVPDLNIREPLSNRQNDVKIKNAELVKSQSNPVTLSNPVEIFKRPTQSVNTIKAGSLATGKSHRWNV